MIVVMCRELKKNRLSPFLDKFKNLEGKESTLNSTKRIKVLLRKLAKSPNFWGTLVRIVWAGVEHKQNTRRKGAKMGDKSKEEHEDPTLAYDDAVITDRSRPTRTLHFVVGMGMAFFIPILVALFFIPGLWWLGILGGVAACVSFWPKTTFFVPQMQALVTLNLVTDEMVGYGPGLHARLWWEEVHEDSNHFLEEVTEPYDESFPTKTDLVHVEFSFGYRPRLKDITRFAAVAPSTIRTGFQGFVESLMATYVGERGLDDLIGHEGKISELLQNAFENGEEEMDESLEERFGIDVTFIKVNRFQLSPEVQKARSAKAEITALNQMTAALLGCDSVEEMQQFLKKGTISRADHERARDDAFIAMGEKVSRTIFRGEGEAFGAAFAALSSVLPQNKNQNRGDKK